MKLRLVNNVLERKLMGTTKKEVAMLGLGCMRFPKKEDGTIDQEQVNQMIDYAYEHGVNYYDTAPVYGDGTSETALVIAINKYPRESYYLSTSLNSLIFQIGHFVAR